MRASTPGQPLLIVEDDARLSGLLAHHLAAHGYAVEVAGSSEEAARLVRAGLRPSLVVLDINLPGDSGWGLLRGGSLDSANAPPVIVVSAVPMSPARLAEFHVAGYLPKPFALATLMATIERLLHQEIPVP